MQSIKKIKFYLNKGLNEFLRKLLFYFILVPIRGIPKSLNRIRFFFYFKKFNIDFGKNITVHGLPFDIDIGDDFVIKDNVVFEFARDANLCIGNSCFLSYGVLISCKEKILIGDYVQIGEYTSIRDTTHTYTDLSVPMKKQGDYSEEIIIGNDVWIGRGCIILPGTVIEDGVVIGANSVVKGYLKSHCIYAGTPAKLIKGR